MHEERTTVTEMDRLGDAEAAIAELRGALARAGVTLPSLGIDPLSYAEDEHGVLVDLGRCSVETVRRMTAALPAEGTGR